jgi:hypothetical protein
VGEQLDWVVVVGSLTGLLAVVSSGVVAIVTIRNQASTAAEERAQEFLLALLPRRVEAFERVWTALYTVESGGHLTDGQQETIVASSLWLPTDVRERTLAILADSAVVSHERAAEARRVLQARSGADSLTRIQDYLEATTRGGRA